MSESIQPPPTWSATDLGFTRHLQGSEAQWAGRSLLYEGMLDSCFGFSFSADIVNIQQVFVDAIAYLRFTAPLIAADMIKSPDNPESFVWVYNPMSSQQELMEWAKRTLTIHDPAPSDEEFIRSMNQKRLPYECFPSRKQFFGAHLLLRPNGIHSFFIHGTHAILDARPNFQVLRTVFEVVTKAKKLPPLDSLIDKGDDVRNLPPNFVHMLGEEQFEALRTVPLEYPKGVTSDETPLGLCPQRETLAVPDLTVRVNRSLDEATSKAVLSAVKALGFSVTVLCDASFAMATGACNNGISGPAKMLLDLSVISLDRFFLPERQATDYIVSSMTTVPIATSVDPARPRRQQLLDIMGTFQKQYNGYIAQPVLPFSDLVDSPPKPWNSNLNAPWITNLGVIDRFIPPVWPDTSLRIHDLHFGHRFAGAPRPGLHVWSFNNRFHWQIQAGDTYDTSYLESFMDKIVESLLAILDDE